MAETSNEPVMESWHWRSIRQSLAAILLAASGVKRLPKNWPLPKHTLDLQRYLVALEFEWSLDATLALTEDVLKKVSAKLSGAHLIAAKVTMSTPTEAVVAAVKEDLKTISNALKNEERFRLVVQFADSVAQIVDRLAPVA
jgi:hypothetical protein